MKKNKFDKYLSRVAILALAGCFVSVFRIAYHYFLPIVHLPEQAGHWNAIFPTLVAVFVISLFVGLCCFVVQRIRK